MNISIIGNDGILYPTGIPQLVIVNVIFDDGKKTTIPYPAGKTIQELFADLAAAGNIPNCLAPMVPIDGGLVDTPTPAIPKILPDNSCFEPEDIVECLVKGEDNIARQVKSVFQIGKKFRLMEIIPSGKKIFYHIIDDSAMQPERIPVEEETFKASFKIFQKGKLEKIRKPNHIMEAIRVCPACSKNFLLTQKERSGDYLGKCGCGVIYKCSFIDVPNDFKGYEHVPNGDNGTKRILPEAVEVVDG
jgi:hypothetical protein